MYKRAILVLTLLAGCGRGCGEAPAPSASPDLAQAEAKKDPSAEEVPVPIEPLELGKPTVGVIDGTLPSCKYVEGELMWVGPCRRFKLTAPAGALEAHLSWSVDAPLTFVMRRADRKPLKMNCCMPPRLSISQNVEGGDYLLDVLYNGRPPGFPKIDPVSFEVVASSGPARKESPADLGGQAPPKAE